MDALTQRVSQESGRIADVAVACHQRNRGKASGSAWAAHSALVAAASADAEFVRRYGVKVKACQAGNAKRKSNIERPFRDLKESFLQGADGGRCPQTRSTNSITLARSPTWFTFAPSPGTGSAARSHQLLGQSVEVRLAVDSVESDCRGPGRRSPGTASPGGIVEGWGLAHRTAAETDALVSNRRRHLHVVTAAPESPAPSGRIELGAGDFEVAAHRPDRLRRKS